MVTDVVITELLTACLLRPFVVKAALFEMRSRQKYWMRSAQSRRMNASRLYSRVHLDENSSVSVSS